MADFATLVGTYARGFAIITEPFDERMPAVRDPVMQVLNSKLMLFACAAKLLLFSCVAKLLLFTCSAMPRTVLAELVFLRIAEPTKQDFTSSLAAFKNDSSNPAGVLFLSLWQFVTSSIAWHDWCWQHQLCIVMHHLACS